MQTFNLKTAAVITLLLGTTALITPALAADEAIVKTANGIAYVSGGVGDASSERMSSLAKDFNLKLVFALKSGDYVSGVNVTIANAAGKTLLDTTSEGPLFLTKLPGGSYKIVATLGGKSESRTIAVDGQKLRTVDFRWAGE
jgi:hypothetical protein